VSAVLKPEVRFRPITEADLDRLLEIEQQAHVSPWTRGIFRDCIRVNYICTVMELGVGIAGYSIFNIAVDEAHLFNICINPQFQRQGFGRILLEHILDQCRERQAKSVFLEVRPSNVGAIALYESAGFVEVGIRTGYYPANEGRREDALIFARDV